MDGAPEKEDRPTEAPSDAPLSANGRVIRPEWLVRFKNDATTHLEEIHRIMALLPAQLGQTATQEEAEAEQKRLHELFRRAHSLKGAALMVGREEIGEAARQLEEILRQAYTDPNSFDPTRRKRVRQQIKGLQTLINHQLTGA